MEILFLHALPLDGSMWDAQRSAISLPSHAPALYGFGETLADWAKGALALTDSRKLILVGCSVGGSCALEIAALAPERIAGMVLIGTKANCRPEPLFRQEAVRVIREEGKEVAWQRYWQPLFAASCNESVVASAQDIMMRQSIDHLVRGVDVFHTRAGRADLLRILSYPIAVLTGEYDNAPGLKASRAQAAMAPFGQLHVIGSSGHYVPLEQPGGLNLLLQGFVAACRQHALATTPPAENSSSGR